MVKWVYNGTFDSLWLKVPYVEVPVMIYFFMIGFRIVEVTVGQLITVSFDWLWSLVPHVEVIVSGDDLLLSDWLWIVVERFVCVQRRFLIDCKSLMYQWGNFFRRFLIGFVL